MSDTFSSVMGRARAILAGFTTGQKVITVLAVVGLIFGGYVFSSWAAKPAYAPLFSNLPAADASAIVDKLGSSGVPYQLADAGQTIMVPKDKVYATRLQMSGQGLPAGDGSGGGYALLDKAGITASDFRQHVAYQRALEGEIAKTVASIDGVNGAVVHLAIPQQDVFGDSSQAATASVLVGTEAGKKLTPQQVQAIVHLVSSSVGGLSPDQVTVADSAGRVLSVPGDGGVDAAGDAKNQAEQEYEHGLEQKAQDMLDRVVGTGHSVVHVTADLDFDKHTTNTDTYTQPTKAPTSADTQTTETYTGGAAGTGGVLGAGGIATTTGTGTGTGTNYTKSSATRNNALNHEVDQKVSAGGEVKRLTVAVLLDGHTAGAVDTTQISGLVANAVGVDTTRGDNVQVGRMAFDQSAAAEAKAQLDAARKQESSASMMSMVRTGALFGIIALIMLFSWLGARRRRKTRVRSELDQEELEELRKAVTLQIAADKQRALDPGGSGMGELERSPLDQTPSKLAIVHDEIADMVERQPDEVAQLLRGWLADRRS